MRHDFEIGAPDAGRRIERYLQRALGDAPHSLIQKLLRKGDVKRNGQRARAGELLAAGDRLIVHLPAQQAAAPSAPLPPYAGPPLRELARDADYLALDKAAGARCSIDRRPELSVQAWLAELLRAEIAQAALRPELCHRLDAGTTGVVLVALHALAFTAFHRALAAGELRKRYRVLVHGRPESTEWLEQRALRRLPHAPSGRPKVVAAERGEGAQTRFRWLGSAQGVSLLEAEPISGRTHQIRAHLHAAGLPVVGDPRYGDARRDRKLAEPGELAHQLLHARLLAWGERRYQAEPPRDFLALCRRLGLDPDTATA